MCRVKYLQHLYEEMLLNVSRLSPLTPTEILRQKQL